MFVKTKRTPLTAALLAARVAMEVVTKRALVMTGAKDSRFPAGFAVRTVADVTFFHTDFKL